MDPQIEGIPEALDFCRKAARQKDRQPGPDEITRLRESGITFTRKYTETRPGAGGIGPVEFTYEKYEASSAQRAVEFLKRLDPVTQNYYYIEVKTPEGWAGRDIDGTY